jgi:hypothetical protein
MQNNKGISVGIHIYKVHSTLMSNKSTDYSYFITELFVILHTLTLQSAIIPLTKAITVGKQM